MFFLVSIYGLNQGWAMEEAEKPIVSNNIASLHDEDSLEDSSDDESKGFIKVAGVDVLACSKQSPENVVTAHSVQKDHWFWKGMVGLVLPKAKPLIGNTLEISSHATNPLKPASEGDQISAANTVLADGIPHVAGNFVKIASSELQKTISPGHIQDVAEEKDDAKIDKEEANKTQIVISDDIHTSDAILPVGTAPENPASSLEIPMTDPLADLQLAQQPLTAIIDDKKRAKECNGTLNKKQHIQAPPAVEGFNPLSYLYNLTNNQEGEGLPFFYQAAAAVVGIATIIIVPQLLKRS